MIILKLLGVGYLIDLICNVYLLLRVWVNETSLGNDQQAHGRSRNQKELWFGISLFCMCLSLVWSFIGGAVYYLLPHHSGLINVFLFSAFAGAAALQDINTAHKLDYVVICAITLLGVVLIVPRL